MPRITDEQIEQRYNEIIDDPMYAETARPLAKWVRDQYEAEGKETTTVDQVADRILSESKIEVRGLSMQEYVKTLVWHAAAKGYNSCLNSIAPLHQSEEAKPTEIDTNGHKFIYNPDCIYCGIHINYYRAEKCKSSPEKKEAKPEDIKANFVCGSCGAQMDNMKDANDHMNGFHPTGFSKEEEQAGEKETNEQRMAKINRFAENLWKDRYFCDHMDGDSYRKGYLIFRDAVFDVVNSEREYSLTAHPYHDWTIESKAHLPVVEEKEPFNNGIPEYTGKYIGKMVSNGNGGIKIIADEDEIKEEPAKKEESVENNSGQVNDIQVHSAKGFEPELTEQVKKSLENKEGEWTVKQKGAYNAWYAVNYNESLVLGNINGDFLSKEQAENLCSKLNTSTSKIDRLRERGDKAIKLLMQSESHFRLGGEHSGLLSRIQEFLTK